MTNDPSDTLEHHIDQAMRTAFEGLIAMVKYANDRDGRDYMRQNPQPLGAIKTAYELTFSAVMAPEPGRVIDIRDFLSAAE